MKSSKILKSLLIFGSYFIYTYLIVILLSVTFALFGVKLSDASDLIKYWILMGTDLLYIIFLIAVYRKELKEKFKDFRKNFSKYMDTGIKYWIIGLIIMVASNKLISVFTPSQMAQNEQSVRELFDTFPIYTLVATSLFAPFVEELIFRKSIKDIINTKWIYILFSGFIFGSIHVVSSLSGYYDFFYIIPYGALGASLAYMYYKTDNIFVSMMMHAIHNTILVSLLFFM